MDIKYNPKLSIKKNAQINGCSESAIRKYIFQNSIDRRYDRKVSLIMELRKIYSDGMSAYALSLKAKKSINTINKYWEYIISEKELSDFDTEKKQKVKVPAPGFLGRGQQGRPLSLSLTGKPWGPINIPPADTGVPSHHSSQSQLRWLL